MTELSENAGPNTPHKSGHARQSAAPCSNSSTHNTPEKAHRKPKSQRELRCLQALIDNPNGIYRHELDVAVGAQNSPEYVSRLRMAGWEVVTDRVPLIDRDGRKVRVGRYSLSSSQHDAAAAVLES